MASDGNRDGPLAAALQEADGVADVFDLVKEAVEDTLDASRTGIMVGLVDLGVAPGRYLGGYYQVGGNTVVVNRSVVRHVRLVAPDLEEAYLFSVLLHEYLHTLGLLSEARVRRTAREVSEEALGPDHPATRMAAAMAGEGSGAGGPEALRRDRLLAGPMAARRGAGDGDRPGPGPRCHPLHPMIPVPGRPGEHGF